MVRDGPGREEQERLKQEQLREQEQKKKEKEQKKKEKKQQKVKLEGCGYHSTLSVMPRNQSDVAGQVGTHGVELQVVPGQDSSCQLRL